MFNVKILLIAIFLTETKNLIPIPLSETQREVGFALMIMLLGFNSFYKLKPRIMNAILPIMFLILLGSIFDILLDRFGFYSTVFWVKLLTLISIAVVVYDLGIERMKSLIQLCAIILIIELIVYLQYPSFFAAAGRSIGVADSFTIYGNDNGRIYYAFFQPNIAAHSIFFLFLSWYAICSTGIRATRGVKYGIALAFIVLGILTGSRAFIFLLGSFLLSRLFIKKSRMVLACVTLMPFVILFLVPIQSALIDLYLLREESNIARLLAMKQYIHYIEVAPIFGIGHNVLRYYDVVLGAKPSHVLYIELLAAYGVFIGSAIILWLFYILVVQVRSTSLANVGFFALASGLFSSSTLLLPTFFPLLVPAILALSLVEKLRHAGLSQMAAPTNQTPASGRS